MEQWMLARRILIEVGKIAGHWELDNLIVILDAKEVTLDENLSK